MRKKCFCDLFFSFCCVFSKQSTNDLIQKNVTKLFGWNDIEIKIEIKEQQLFDT